jgi:pyruvate/2-oxoacid:ferredoxin oxidoreductase alpha subunit
MRGTAQNSDVHFQSRETCNKFYEATPAIVQKYMDMLAKETGRAYRLYEYVGAADAERVVVAMGSGCETLHETVEALVKNGEKAGAVRGFTVAGNFYELLKQVKAVGSEVEHGICGFSMTAAPAILVQGISVAGAE